jgi:hypothetical protein
MEQVGVIYASRFFGQIPAFAALRAFDDVDARQVALPRLTTQQVDQAPREVGVRLAGVS